MMVVSTSAGSKPRPVTRNNSDEVYDLKWLNNNAIVFDRVADEQFYGHARIWKAIVPPRVTGHVQRRNLALLEFLLRHSD